MLPRPKTMGDLLKAFDELVTELEKRLPARTFTIATLPDPASVPVGTIVYVSDGGPGNLFRASSGSAWINLG